MAKKLPNDKGKRIKELIFRRADEFGFATSGRIENGRFLDELVNDPEIGGVLKEYMEKERVRTYIKDGVLNAYTKQLTRKAFLQTSTAEIVRSVYSTEADVIQSTDSVTVLRSSDGRLYVISKGRVLKWETALKKALELIARQPGLNTEGSTPEICLQLATLNSAMTDSEANHIRTSLSVVGVKAVFCGE